MDRNERLKRARECSLWVTYNRNNDIVIGVVSGYSKMPDCVKVTLDFAATKIIEDVNIKNITKSKYSTSIYTNFSRTPIVVNPWSVVLKNQK